MSGGGHGQPGFRMPRYRGRSLNRHRNGRSDAPTVGVGRGLLSVLPTDTSNGGNRVLASSTLRGRHQSSLGLSHLSGCDKAASGRASWGRLFLYCLIMTRRFPPPWTVEQIPGGYKVKDANGQSLAYVYGRETQAAADIAKVLTLDQA